MGSHQYHDEPGASVADESQAREALKQGIEMLNRELKLNVGFGIDVKSGQTYSDVH